jgi:putative holliday junction resolvase
MRSLSLDLGEKWVGTALSDKAGIVCSPHKTMHIDVLTTFLEETLSNGEIGTVVVGYPLLLNGEVGTQAKIVSKIFDSLKEKFGSVKNNLIDWVLWDESLSSHMATPIVESWKKNKNNKKKEHSVAAAFILQGYLNRNVSYE